MHSFTSYKSYEILKKLSQNSIDLTKDDVLTSKRINKMLCECGPFKMLYATELITDEVIGALIDLAKESKAIEQMRAMQSGEIVNHIKDCKCENRCVLHTATRDLFDDKKKSKVAISAAHLARVELDKLEKFLQKNDKKFENLIQVGIGGSFLGPKALYYGLKAYQKNKKKIHFISNVDPDDAVSILDDIDLSKTLIVSVSKSGTTLETHTNEEIVKYYLKKQGLNPKDHIVAVTAKGSPMDDPSQYLESFYIWDYVGGRYSATSMVGAVTLSFAFGIDVFKELLKGADDMDKASLSADLTSNLPLFSALIGIWNHNFLSYPTMGIIPYSQALLYFPLHLQQLDMESNGKHINKNGHRVDFKTGPVIFGDIGTNAQHSFYQLLHQGTEKVPLEFLGFVESQYSEDLIVKDSYSQEKLLSNLIAQSIALAKGQKNENLNKEFKGNRPNHIIMAKKLDPYTLGSLLSYYENRVAFQGFIWNINSFDQEGVQLGKVLANQILEAFISKRSNKEIKFDIANAYLDKLDF